MLTRKGRRFLTAAIVLLVCILGAAGWAIYHFFFSGSAEMDDEGNQVVVLTPLPLPPVPTPMPTPIPPTPPPPEPPAADSYVSFLTGDELTNIELDPADIHSGLLILVNNQVSYEIPEDLDLIQVVDGRTADFRVNPAGQRMHRDAAEPLNKLIDAFNESTPGWPTMVVISAFRSYESQQWILNNHIYQYGQAAALQRTKRPGYSEHHTGFAFDFGTYADGNSFGFDYFAGTRWFFDNAYKYGFNLRYPGDKTAITETMYEPWHFRYFGMPHSYIMHNNKWVLEEYIENIREFTQEEPLMVTYDDIDYEVFFTTSSSITVPKYADFNVSGNNIDGFIVTISNQYGRLTNVASE